MLNLNPNKIHSHSNDLKLRKSTNKTSTNLIPGMHKKNQISIQTNLCRQFAIASKETK